MSFKSRSVGWSWTSDFDTAYPESAGEWIDATTLQDGLTRHRFVSESSAWSVVLSKGDGAVPPYAFKRRDGYWEWEELNDHDEQRAAADDDQRVAI